MARTKSSSSSSSSSSRRPLAGKVALVTGAAHRPVYDIALELARQGAKLVATYDSHKDAHRIATLASRIAALHSSSSSSSSTPHCITLLVDLHAPGAAAALAARAVAAFGAPIDILINTPHEESRPSSSASSASSFVSVSSSLSFASRTFSNNPTIALPDAVLPYLAPAGSGARIISLVATGARPNAEAEELSPASRDALVGMTRRWASDLLQSAAAAGGPRHTANVVDLGAAEGELFAATPVDEAVKLVSWLVSEESWSVSGRVLDSY